jgi:hypothetical protein
MTSTTDPAGHQTLISYADSYSDGIYHASCAYPTTITDPDGNSSLVQYNFDFGAVTQKQGPSPNAGQARPQQNFTYDSAARVTRVSNSVDSGYTKYVYGPTYLQTYTTVNNIADEGYSIQFFDGAGRGYYSASINPGTIGGFRGVTTVYDVMGRVWQKSNPTEVTSGSYPTGEDVGGWLYTVQTYDWKSRPLVATNPDRTSRSASYYGCGCAGGQVATMTDEVGRQGRVTQDVLGRIAKKEVLNTDGTTYSTTSNTYNPRDQVMRLRQYQGNDQSSTYRDTAMAYDGHGAAAIS